MTPASTLPSDPRILCIRLSALGDTLLTLPAVQLLRQAHPGAHVTYLTDARHAELLETSELVDHLLLLDRHALTGLRPSALLALVRETLSPLVRGSWDLVVDFQSYTETALLGALTRAPVRVGRRYKTSARWLYKPWVEAPHPECYMPLAHADTLLQTGLIEAAPSTVEAYLEPPAAARASWATQLAATGIFPGGRRIALFVGAARADRRWPVASYAALAVELQQRAGNLSFIVLAGPDEGELAQAVVDAVDAADADIPVAHVPTASLSELAAGLDDCTAAICNDTGPLHISVAVGTPTCGIYRRPLAHFLAPPPHACVVAPDRQVDRIEVAEVADAAATLL